MPESLFDEKKLLLELLKTISSGWVSPIHFERLAKDFRVPDGAPTIFFLTGIMQIIRELPVKIFEDEMARMALLDALQASIDAAISREEASHEDET